MCERGSNLLKLLVSSTNECDWINMTSTKCKSIAHCTSILKPVTMLTERICDTYMFSLSMLGFKNSQKIHVINREIEPLSPNLSVRLTDTIHPFSVSRYFILIRVTGGGCRSLAQQSSDQRQEYTLDSLTDVK